jgi:hypothetical protein
MIEKMAHRIAPKFVGSGWRECLGEAGFLVSAIEGWPICIRHFSDPFCNIS